MGSATIQEVFQNGWATHWSLFR